MPKEIEKKYLISKGRVVYGSEELSRMYPTVEELRKDVLQNGKSIIQGYLPLQNASELSALLNIVLDFDPIEARLRNKEGEFSFTQKAKGGVSRDGLDVDINQDIFDAYWSKTKGKRVDKVRLDKPYQGHTAEIDVYLDRELIVAEVEVPTMAEAEKLKPLGQDVSEDESYKNKNLAQ